MIIKFSSNSFINLSISCEGILVLIFSFSKLHPFIALLFETYLYLTINLIIFKVLMTSTPFFSAKILSLLSPVAKIQLLSLAIM